MGASPSASRPPRADVRRRREAILEAARAELGEDPSAGLQRIAERAGVHRATLHRHFRTREELLSALFGRYVDEVAARLDEVDEDDSATELDAITRICLRVNVRYHVFAWAPVVPTREHAGLRRGIERMLAAAERAQAAGTFRRDIPAGQLRLAWGTPLPFLAGRIAAGSMSEDEAVTFSLQLLRPLAA